LLTTTDQRFEKEMFRIIFSTRLTTINHHNDIIPERKIRFPQALLSCSPKGEEKYIAEFVG